MNKLDLRNKYKALRQNLTAVEVEDKSIAIANQLLKLDIWSNLYFHLFLPIKEQNEIDTEHILNILFAKNKEIVVSKSDFTTGNMQHFLLTENTRFKKNEYNIPEPIDGIEVPLEKLDVVFVPLLAYDQNGNRVGYGKGFYDRFLKNTNALKVGLSFFEAEEEIQELFEQDIPLDFCVSPNKNYSF
ncbi:5-formyltetrahydrofolate cyclo-ligase [Flavicella sediminum]|uniref:5-formyltetrahydrofolate cyclo-ligase n=1 Tax=Flavicella sediminum TaxID=2585141 RepID=UPI001120E014|nr:5-formyltetrahydrofolate cyclo-ligase [Flavicella sediminum]